MPEEEYLEVDDATYRPLKRVDEALDATFREQYLDVFFSRSRLNVRHRREADDMLLVDVGDFDTGERVLRLEFPFLGSTSWWEWDGTPEEALKIATEAAEAHGTDIVMEQQGHGSTGWET